MDRTPYWQQGNLIYYSEDMIVARMRHLDSKKINDALSLWRAGLLTSSLALFRAPTPRRLFSAPRAPQRDRALRPQHRPRFPPSLSCRLKVIPKLSIGMTVGPGGVIHTRQVHISKEAYIDMACKINRSMMPGQEDSVYLEQAEEDWAEDSGGANVMNEAQFRYALFQLADLWTDSVDSGDYARCGARALTTDLHPPLWMAVN